MDRLIISGEGYPGTNEYLAFAEKSSQDMINAITKVMGNSIIIDGMIETDGVLSIGSLIHNNEILPFVSGNIDETIVVIEEITNAGYDLNGNGDFNTILPIWKKRYCKFGNPGDLNVVDSFPFSTLTRIDNIQQLQNRLKVLRHGYFQYRPPTNYLVVFGAFTSGEVITSQDDLIRIKLNFEPVNLGYVINLNRRVSNTTFPTSDRLVSIIEMTENSLSLVIQSTSPNNTGNFAGSTNVDFFVTLIGS